MKKYEFRAVRSGKQETIIGFAFSAIIMFPILAIQLGLFYTGLDKSIKSNQSSLFEFGYVFFMFLIICASFFLVSKIQKKLVKNYVVELNVTNIKILENGKEIMSGSVSYCEIINKAKGNHINNVSIIIYTDTDKITVKLRSKKWNNIMGSFQLNPLGTSDAKDMKIALGLSKDIKEILEKYVSAN